MVGGEREGVVAGYSRSLVEQPRRRNGGGGGGVWVGGGGEGGGVQVEVRSGVVLRGRKSGKCVSLGMG